MPDQDPQAKADAKRVNSMKFRDAADILLRFPFPDQLEEEGADGSEIYSWRGKVVASQDIVEDLISHVFVETGVASLGRDRLYSLCQSQFWCISSPQCAAFLRTNTEAQVHRGRHKSQASRPYVAPYPGARVFIDCTDYGPGFKKLLCAVDSFSKKIVAVPFISQTAGQIAEKFENVILPAFGIDVKQVAADQGGEFMGAPFQNMLARHGIKFIKRRSHAPTGNYAETTNRTVKSMLTSAIGQLGETPKGALAKVLRAYNNSVSVTGFAPNVLCRDNIPPAIIAAVRARMLKGTEGAMPNAKYQAPLKSGDKVRLDILYWGSKKGENGNYISNLALYKSGMFKSTHQETWSRKIYTIATVFPQSNTATITEAVAVKSMPETVHERGYHYPRSAFQLVDPDTEEDDPENEDENEPELPPAAPVAPIQPVAARTRGRVVV